MDRNLLNILIGVRVLGRRVVEEKFQ